MYFAFREPSIPHHFVVINEAIRTMKLLALYIDLQPRGSQMGMKMLVLLLLFSILREFLFGVFISDDISARASPTSFHIKV